MFGGDSQATVDGLSWQSNNDVPSRKEILSKIVTFLQQLWPNEPPDAMQNVRFFACVSRIAQCFDRLSLAGDVVTLVAQFLELYLMQFEICMCGWLVYISACLKQLICTYL